MSYFPALKLFAFSNILRNLIHSLTLYLQRYLHIITLNTHEGRKVSVSVLHKDLLKETLRKILLGESKNGYGKVSGPMLEHKT
jgi:hypothetical protein